MLAGTGVCGWTGVSAGVGELAGVDGTVAGGSGSCGMI